MLRFLSVLYCSIIQLRNLLYDTGVFRTYHTGPLVISVGNIEAGGTGKTPFTMTLAKKIKERGYTVAILTRGYKGRLRGTHLVRPEHQVADVGDETLLMARTSGMPVVKSPDRVAGAHFAHTELGAQIVVLDDGFQHRRIYRDLDIVLIARNVQTDNLLPLGSLREPVSSLKRAALIVYTKGAPEAQGLSAKLVPVGLADTRGKQYGLEVLKDKRVLAVCAIGKPEPFFSILEQLGACVEPLVFRDHHLYTLKDIQMIRQRSLQKDLIITTQKDMVKLDSDLLDNRWLELQVIMQVPQIDTIIREIETIAENRRIPRQG
ncbi:MAG TPA: tetraacyldisaccharide 4'-kinase [Deltaproteobacteria bacterium]|nr:tetraacyldisaccharide 4'-kinase [Deltaproteobacteria bacterium]